MRTAIFNLFAFPLLILPAAVFAQTQSPCTSTVSITDTSKADPAVILVIANSSQASYTITGPSTYKGSGWNFIHQNILPGTYAITWGSVAGCETPPPETKTTDISGSIGFAGNYKDTRSERGSGTIDITTNIQQKKVVFTISGPEGTRKIEGNAYSWYYAPAGTYTVSFGPAEAFHAPPPQTKALSDGGIITFSGEYKVETGYFLNIRSSPPSARAYVNDKFVGVTPVKVQLPMGEVIKIRCFLDGYYDYFYNEFNLGKPVIPLGPETSRAESSHNCVLKDKKTSSKVGKIVVTWQPPLEIVLRVTGPNSQYLPSVTSFTWDNAPVGTYTVTYGNSLTGGFSTPRPQIKTLKEGETLIFEGKYLTEKELSEQQRPDKDIFSGSPQKSQGVFKKIQNAISLFFSRIFSIFGRRSSPPVIVQTSENDLQGLWKIEKLYTADSAGGWKEPEASSAEAEEAKSYFEFRGDKACNGPLGADGVPLPCQNYFPFTVSADKISIAQPDGTAVHGTWKIADGRLELNVEATQASKVNKFRILLTKLDRPFSNKQAPEAIPAQPLQPVPAEQPVR